VFPLTWNCCGCTKATSSRTRKSACCRTLRGPVMVGAHSEFFVIDTAEQHSVAGVHFKPGALSRFLVRPPASCTTRI